MSRKLEKLAKPKIKASSVQAFAWAEQLSKEVNIPLVRLDVNNLPIMDLGYYPAFYYSANRNKMLFCIVNENKTMHFWEIDNYKEFIEFYPELSKLYIGNGEQLYRLYYSSRPIVTPTLLSPIMS